MLTSKSRYFWSWHYVFVFREGPLKGVKKRRDKLYVSILEKSTSYRQSTIKIKGVNRGRDQLWERADCILHVL